jgi:hypothetical protein
MPIRKQHIQPIGMMQDGLINNVKSSQFAHEIKNLRFNTQGDYVTASWTTEQSTLELTVEGLPENTYLDKQIPVGQAVINNQLILFITSSLGNADRIIKLTYKNNTTLKAKILYEGNINLNAEHPLETIVFYENDSIQKVYWTDGFNQPRVINISDEFLENFTNNTYPVDWQFDFVKELSLKENVVVAKQQGGNGQFPPCTVKYAITYYNKYGQESNIAWTSTLFYPTKGERGLKEGELSGDTFVITVNNVDITHNFDYIRLYSIVRTTNNATPIVRIVENKSIKDISSSDNSITFYDSNTTGEIIDPTILNYVGGVQITAETFDQKDNVLFLGNIGLKTQSLESLNVSFPTINGAFHTETESIVDDNVTTTNIVYGKSVNLQSTNMLYPYKSQLNGNVLVYRGNTTNQTAKIGTTLESPKIFKYNEYYRFGIQCQDRTGVWSDVVYIDDYINTTTPSDIGRVKLFPIFKYTIDKDDAITLTSNGYRKARLVCCYPSNSDKSILAQGVLNTTVYNKKWNEKHLPDYISDWFYRVDNLPDNLIINDIQSIRETYTNNELNQQSELSPNDSNFFQFKELVTLHSPDIEFNESLETLDFSNIQLKKIGEISNMSYASKLYLDYSKKAEDYLGNKGDGIDTNRDTWLSNNISNDVYRQNCYWNDIDVYNANLTLRQENEASTGKAQIDYIKYNYIIYPFQRKYLNNFMGTLKRPVIINNGKDVKDGFTVEESSIINNKIYSELFCSKNTTYANNATNISSKECLIFDYGNVAPLKFSDGKLYYGNVDTIVPLYTGDKLDTEIYVNQGLFHEASYPYYIQTIDSTIGGCDEDSDDVITKYKGDYRIKSTSNRYNIDEQPVQIGVSSDPIKMSYKSTPHCVIELNADLSYTNRTLCLAELHRDITQDQRFGGKSTDALLNNVFLPCGEAVDLEQYDTSGGQSTRTDVILVGDVGDTYYMRYDNLKTYPYTRESTNGIVEIMSFMCESHINLDGRCDTNRGLIDNTLIDNTNFNIINKSYTQDDNFFNYRILDENTANLDKFTNQITWTKTKNAGEEIDTWTNITLANVADAEGTLGKITKICNNKNSLILFQENGIATIGYNEKTALSTEKGVPLEIANSGKFTGIDYYTKNIGCQNKWSINNNKNGIFWIDDNRRQLFTFGENSPIPISTQNGFDAFFINNLEGKNTIWSPKDFYNESTLSNFVTYYDNISKDIYYINNDYCLAWNEVTNTFTSFYDYNKTHYICNISQHCLMIYLNGDTITFHSAREDDSYNKFFGTPKPYWITLLSNGGADDKNNYATLDKVFNTIEFKGDLFNENAPVLNDNVNMINVHLFTDIAAYNGYQMYKEFKIDGRYLPKNNYDSTTQSYTSLNQDEYHDYPWQAERKFNIWRVMIPRATYLQSDGTLKTGRDRIRDTYSYIKLINNNPEKNFDSVPYGVNYNRAILRDFEVYFDVK